MPDVKLRSNYKSFKNRCRNCGHRGEMHQYDLDGVVRCNVTLNGFLPDKSKDRRCNCR